MIDEPKPRGWLNPTVIGAGLTSFLADVCYEMAGAVLPGFLLALGLPAPQIVGLVEGAADALSNFAKLGVGWYSDRIGRRKPLVSWLRDDGLTRPCSLGWPDPLSRSSPSGSARASAGRWNAILVSR